LEELKVSVLQLVSSDGRGGVLTDGLAGLDRDKRRSRFGDGNQVLRSIAAMNVQSLAAITLWLVLVALNPASPNYFRKSSNINSGVLTCKLSSQS